MKEQEHFIKNIEIKNFKCFEDFKAEGFGRVNLIGGKNNVGKTAFMEAVYVNVVSNKIENLILSLYELELIRNYIEYVDEELPEMSSLLDKIAIYKTVTNIREVNFSVEVNSAKKLYHFFNEIKTKNDFSQDYDDYNDIDNIKFIDNFGYTKYQLQNVYASVQKKDAEAILNNYINEFDKNILNFKMISGDMPQCKTVKGEYRDINDFGNGLKDYISIICSLYACENNYLFIDEIENGIHYSHLDKLWEIILTISKQQNVQVFATTHSKECIESYARVVEELNDKDITFIKLGKNKKDEIKAMTYPYDWFVDSVEQEQELRGW